METITFGSRVTPDCEIRNCYIDMCVALLALFKSSGMTRTKRGKFKKLFNRTDEKYVPQTTFTNFEDITYQPFIDMLVDLQDNRIHFLYCKCLFQLIESDMRVSYAYQYKKMTINKIFAPIKKIRSPDIYLHILEFYVVSIDDRYAKIIVNTFFTMTTFGSYNKFNCNFEEYDCDDRPIRRHIFPR